MAPHDDDRIAYLAGEDGRSLSPAERAELDELRELLASPATWAQPDPGLEERVVTAIAGETAPRSRDAGERRRRSFSRGRLRLLPRPMLGLAGAAAAAAAAIALAIVLSVGGGSRPPQQFAMVVSGTQLAPDAHGSATLTKTASGWRIELSAPGLPRLSGERYYEAWLKNTRGVLVPVGTFNDARRVTLWAGVPVPSFPTLSVTRQRVGAGPASSGQRVLGGTIRPGR